MSQKIRKAVFPVAGKGTRFMPATKAVPKEMLPILCTPLIEHAVNEAKEAGIEEFIFVTAHGKEAIEKHFDEPNFKFTIQQQALGLGHAVGCARELVGNEPFAVLLPDELMQGKPNCLKQMADAFAQTNANIVGVDQIPKHKTGSYGIIVPESEMQNNQVKLVGMVEKPKPEEAPSDFAIVGRYILKPEIFNELEKGKTGAGGEIQLTDAMAAMLQKQDYYAVKFDGNRFDCGGKLGYTEAQIAFGLQDSEIAGEVRELVKKYAAK